VLSFFAIFGESKPSLCQYKTMGKRFVGLYLEPWKGHSHKRVARQKPLYRHTGISTSWGMRWLLWASRPWKGPKIGNFASPTLSTCSVEQGGVRNSILPAMFRVETPSLGKDLLQALKLLSFCCFQSISTLRSSFWAIFWASCRRNGDIQGCKPKHGVRTHIYCSRERFPISFT
jgi:hypothetical protein